MKYFFNNYWTSCRNKQTKKNTHKKHWRYQSSHIHSLCCIIWPSYYSMGWGKEQNGYMAKIQLCFGNMLRSQNSSPHLLMAASHNSDPSFDTSSPSTSLTFSYARFTSWMALASAGSSRASGFTSSASCCCPVIGPVGVTWLMAGGWRTRTITARSCSCWRRNLSRLLWDAQRSVF